MFASDRIAKLVEWLRFSRFVCVMTGAGVSAESGLATFRGPDGLWNGRDPAEVATPQAFAADPREVWRFYRWRLEQASKAAPNAGHAALAQLQAMLPGFGLVTQNVDRLHQRAGSRDVVELHGTIREVRCVACSHRADASDTALPDEPRCPDCGDWLRPCVVWFNESLPEAEAARAAEMTQRCDVFLSIGTSGMVYPAAQFAYDAASHGARVVEINLEPTPLTSAAHLSIQGQSGEILPQVVTRLQSR